MGGDLNARNLINGAVGSIDTWIYRLTRILEDDVRDGWLGGRGACIFFVCWRWQARGWGGGRGGRKSLALPPAFAVSSCSVGSLAFVFPSGAPARFCGWTAAFATCTPLAPLRRPASNRMIYAAFCSSLVSFSALILISGMKFQGELVFRLTRWPTSVTVQASKVHRGPFVFLCYCPLKVSTGS